MNVIMWHFYRAWLICKYGLIWKKPVYVMLLLRNLVKSNVHQLFGMNKFVLRGIDFAPTFECNFNCEHCYTKLLTPADPSKKRRILGIEDYKRLYREATRLGCISFCFQGGGQMLGSGFDFLLQIIGVMHPKTHHITITTNGSFLTEDKIAALKKAHVDTITLSIDSGIEEEHDRFRGVPGNYRNITSLIPLIQRHGIRVFINTVISKDNVRGDGFRKLLDFSHKRRLGLATILAKPLGRWKGQRNRLMSEDDIRYYYKLRKNYPFACRDNDNNYVRRERCYALKENVFITPYGDVCACPFTHVLLGNVFEEPLAVIRDRALKIKWWGTYWKKCLTAIDEEFMDIYYPLVEKYGFPPLGAFMEAQRHTTQGGTVQRRSDT